MSFAATWVDTEIIILSEKSDRESQILYNIIDIWNLILKSDINELI